MPKTKKKVKSIGKISGVFLEQLETLEQKLRWAKHSKELLHREVDCLNDINNNLHKTIDYYKNKCKKTPVNRTETALAIILALVIMTMLL